MSIYNYKAIITRVIDGDTVIADIDLGFGVWLRDQHLRLNAYDAPELHSRNEAERAHAKVARDVLRTFVDIDAQVFVRTYKDKKEKYGRWLADIDINGVDVVTKLRAENCAKRTSY